MKYITCAERSVPSPWIAEHQFDATRPLREADSWDRALQYPEGG